jgi:biopolymer transport protein ExbD
VLALTSYGLTHKGKRVETESLENELAGKRVVLRVDKGLPTGRTWQILAVLNKAGCEISAEVKEASGPVGQKTRSN